MPVVTHMASFIAASVCLTHQTLDSAKELREIKDSKPTPPHLAPYAQGLPALWPSV